ncbi:MAG: glycerol kinase GlpK [Thermoplasmatota archaeon]
MGERRFVLALDEGTTAAGAHVFDARGALVASADREFAQHFPRPGWVEHDAEEIWTATLAAAREVLSKADAAPREIAAIGITNQRETVVAWDARSARPLARALVWQDRRTARRCDALRDAGREREVRRKTGLVLDPYFSASKMEWLVRNVPSVARAARSGTLRFGTIDAWLVAKLTEGATVATDASNASRTMLFDIGKGRWDAELAREFRVPLEALPEVVDSSGRVAETDLFGSRIPISGIAGDQQAALFGQGCFTPGLAKNTYGTGSFLLMNTGRKRPSSRRLLATVAWRVAGATDYALEGSIFTTGAAVQWLRDGLGIVASAHETAELAASVPDTGDVTFVPALAGLGAPHWDAYARGAFLGLTRGTTRAHLVRAVLESIALRTRDVALAMERDSKVKLKTLRVDGGGSANPFLMQFQSDMLGVQVERPRVIETTAQGAAFLAGLGVGLWRSRDELADVLSIDARFAPRMKRKERDARYARWLGAIERAKGWAPSDAPAARERARRKR